MSETEWRSWIRKKVQAANPFLWVIENWRRILEVTAWLAAIGYALVTYFQWRDIRNNFIVDQRAWVSARQFLLTSELDETSAFRARVFIQNTGKTPAIDFMVQNAMALSDHVPPCFQWKQTSTAPNRGILPPNLTDYLIQANLRTPPSQDVVKRYREHKMDLYFYGMARYKDVFGKDHWTQFCGFHTFGDQLTDFGLCGSCNEMDR